MFVLPKIKSDEQRHQMANGLGIIVISLYALALYHVGFFDGIINVIKALK